LRAQDKGIGNAASLSISRRWRKAMPFKRGRAYGDPVIVGQIGVFACRLTFVVPR
jgi:hypothetical protein